MPSSSVHTSVLPAEVRSYLAIAPGMRVVDGTLGGGGHTRLLAEAVGPGGLVVAIDRDPAAIERGARELAGLPIRFAQANFCDLPEVLDALEIDRVDRVLLDVGLSSDQLADHARGFSFESEGPLDLRFDPTEGEPAWRMIARMRPESLADILWRYGEERFSRRIARRIATVREKTPIRSARDLARVVLSAVPRQQPPPRIHPATRTFQALRIAVNQELKSLRIALERIPGRLAPGGRLAVISFHSLEDRLVKEAFRNRQMWESLTRSPVEASPEEVARNPRSRSAKLRAAQIAGNAPSIPGNDQPAAASRDSRPEAATDLAKASSGGHNPAPSNRRHDGPDPTNGSQDMGRPT
jgi:16S rRNA (cytosine1402-N4)-methyltransferase